MRNLDNNRVGNFNAPSHNYPAQKIPFKKIQWKKSTCSVPFRGEIFSLVHGKLRNEMLQMDLWLENWEITWKKIPNT